MRVRWLEDLLCDHATSWTRSRRVLDLRERELAREVFGASLDVAAVVIAEATVLATPAVLGNVIRTSGPMPDRMLVHELTHVWQYQHGGGAYISDSLTAQLHAIVTTGSRRGAYRPTLVPGRPFASYPAEHQAVIVERWFADPTARRDPLYRALVEELRSARSSP